MNNYKKVVLTILLFSSIFLITIGCSNKKDKEKEPNTKVQDEDDDEGERMEEKMEVVINGTTYNVNLESNPTVISLLDLLPIDINMKELNGNEKYFYLDTTLPSNPKKPEKIEKGDIMLYGDDCLVVFYKTFKTDYTYTKIGHIDNLPDLDSNNINIKFIS